VAIRAERLSGKLGIELGRSRRDEWLRTIARVGLASRAVIYVMLGVLASLIVADGRPPAQASGTGALAEISKQPAGPFLVGLLSAGLLCYGGWRVAQAVVGVDPAAKHRPSMAKRAGWLAIAALYFLLFAEAVSILMGGGTSGGPANHPQGVAATVLSWPGGTVLLGAAGTALAVGGVALAVWGCLHDYGRTLDEHRAPAWVRPASRLTGAVGNLARGALLALVAFYTFLAAVDDAPSREKSLDQSLQAVARSPAGPWWIALVAVGLVAFAAYSLFEMRYRRV
jgi:hypothetical protein